VSGQGPGRRLTPDEERRGAELFAQGLSTRAVAEQLGVGNGTAARLRRRLAERAQTAKAPGDSETEETAVTEQTPAEIRQPGADLPASRSVSALTDFAAEDQADDAELSALRGRQEELAAEVTNFAGRAEASRAAVADLEAERLQLLSAGQDAQHLRSRRRDAEDDFADSATAAEIAQGALAVVGEQIAAVEARKAERRLRAELAEAIETRGRVLATIGDRQRAAILAVKAAAEDMCAVVADDRAAQARVEQLAAAVTASAAALGLPGAVVPAAVSTGLTVPAGVTAPLPYSQAMMAAAAGNAAIVAVRLAETWGWLPPDQADIAAEWDRVRALRAAQQAPPSPAPVAEPVLRPGEASRGLDRDGRPLPSPLPRMPEPVAPPFGPPRGHIGGWPI
jgi:hypothetical protein